MMIAQLQEAVSFGADATGVEITTDAIAIKWVTLDFCNQQANYECTLPNRVDVCFSRCLPFDPTTVNAETLVQSLATAMATPEDEAWA